AAPRRAASATSTIWCKAWCSCARRASTSASTTSAAWKKSASPISPAAWPTSRAATSRSAPRPCARAARCAAAPIFRGWPRSAIDLASRSTRDSRPRSNGTGRTTAWRRRRKPVVAEMVSFPAKIARAAGSGASVPVECCQVCGHAPLTRVLSLGYMPPVNPMGPIGEGRRPPPRFPTDLLHCARCDLVQLGLAVDPVIIFPPEYPYTSGTTKLLRDNFAELYSEASALLKLAPHDLVIDIGSNDGTLLSNFKNH